MSLLETVLLAVAGIAAGLSASIAGFASLFSYPALLSVGLPPVIANVTNTVALVGSGVGSALGSRPEFTGQGRRIRRLGAVALVGDSPALTLGIFLDEIKPTGSSASLPRLMDCVLPGVQLGPDTK